MNPQTARWHFKFRTLINAVCVGAGFVLITLFTVQIEGGILIMLVAGGAGYFLFFHVLPNRVIPMSCPHCFGHIATNTPWVCPSCEKKNQNTDEYPFIHRCEHCKTEPKAYICHHKSCGKPIFFSLDTDERLAAVSYSKPAPPPPSPAAERRAEKEDLLHEIEMAELADRLDSIDRRKKLAKEKTPAEEIEESFNRHFSRAMGSQEFARRQRAVNAEKFKDDPEMLQCSNEAIDDWLRSRL